MPSFVFLGTSSAVAYPGHENTHLLFSGRDHHILVDCVGNPVLRLGEAGRSLMEISQVIITHFHPDHVTGFPLLLMNMWLLGRERGLGVYGLEGTLERLQKMMDLFDWASWKGMFPVNFHPLAEEEKTLVLENDDFRVFSSPVDHLLPTIGLRVEFVPEEAVVAYSADTAPCPQVVDLAQGAQILIHEAAGDYRGHTSPAQAGKIAEQARVDQLYLIHYSFHEQDAAAHVAEARKTFRGKVALAEDLMEIEVL